MAGRMSNSLHHAACAALKHRAQEGKPIEAGWCGWLLEWLVATHVVEVGATAPPSRDYDRTSLNRLRDPFPLATPPIEKSCAAVASYIRSHP